MSVDRCVNVKNTITAQFTGAHEGVTGDEPETGGVYTVRANAPTMERAREIIRLATSALSAGGHNIVEAAINGQSQAAAEPREDGSAALVVRVNMGGLRALL